MDGCFLVRARMFYADVGGLLARLPLRGVVVVRMACGPDRAWREGACARTRSWDWEVPRIYIALRPRSKRSRRHL